MAWARRGWGVVVRPVECGLVVVGMKTVAFWENLVAWVKS